MTHMIGPQPVLVYKAYDTLNLSVFEKKNNSEILIKTKNYCAWPNQVNIRRNTQAS